MSLFIVILLIPCIGDARANPDEPLEKVRLQLKWKHQFQFAGYYAAVEKGYYKEAGLEVELIEGRPGMDFVDEVISGRANFGVELPVLLIERSKGQPVVALAAIFQHSPLILLMRKDSGLETLQDLSGHKVMARFDSSAEIQAMFANEGIPMKEIQFMELSWDLNDLLNGKVDALQAYLTNQPFDLQKKGVPYTIIRPLTYGIDFYGDTLFTSEKEIEEYPERVKAFREASLRGWTYAMKHPEEIADLILTTYDLQSSRENILLEAKATHDLLLPDLVEIGHMNPGRWQHIRDTFVKLGMLEPGLSLDGFLYDPNPKPYWSVKQVIILMGAGLAVIVVLLLIWRYVSVMRINRELKTVAKESDIAKEKLKSFWDLIDQSNDSVFVIDPKTSRFLDVNEKACTNLGYTREELLSLGVIDIEAVIQGDFSWDNHVNDVREKGSIILEGEHKRKDGTTFQVEISTKYITQDLKDNIVAFVRDITERKRSEEELKTRTQELEKINNAFVGRELKMAEMKKEIEELKQQQKS